MQCERTLLQHSSTVKINELKRHVPKMQTSNQFFYLFQQVFYCWFISRLLVMAYKKKQIAEN